MFHKGARSTGGDLDGSFIPKIEALLTQFGEITEHRMRSLGLRRAMVRSALQCSLVIILDQQTLWVAAQRTASMPTTLYLDRRTNVFPLQEALATARWEFGFDEPFVIPFAASLLEIEADARAASLEAISQSHIQSELNRVHAQMNVVQINPVFGPASYAVDPRLTFVLMPFTEQLTEIYQTFV